MRHREPRLAVAVRAAASLLAVACGEPHGSRVLEHGPGSDR
jgi:hypothetical protein